MNKSQNKHFCPYCGLGLVPLPMQDNDVGSFWSCPGHPQFEFWLKPAKYRKREQYRGHRGLRNY